MGRRKHVGPLLLACVCVRNIPWSDHCHAAMASPLYHQYGLLVPLFCHYYAMIMPSLPSYHTIALNHSIAPPFYHYSTINKIIIPELVHVKFTKRIQIYCQSRHNALQKHRHGGVVHHTLGAANGRHGCWDLQVKSRGKVESDSINLGFANGCKCVH